MSERRTRILARWSYRSLEERVVAELLEVELTVTDEQDDATTVRVPREEVAQVARELAALAATPTMVSNPRVHTAPPSEGAK